MHAKIGIIGGLSWVATEIYYRTLNELTRKDRGGLSSAPIILDSLDFSELGRIETDAGWERAAHILCGSTRRLEAGGANVIIIAANSMHRVYDEVAAAVSIPILHIADSVGEKMAEDGRKNAGLIGPHNVMTERWYRQRLVGHGISLLPPDMNRAAMVDRVIYDELLNGKINRQSERDLKTILTHLSQEGADSVVLASTELSLIVDAKANVLPIYDSATIHARAAYKWHKENS